MLDVSFQFFQIHFSFQSMFRQVFCHLLQKDFAILLIHNFIFCLQSTFTLISSIVSLIPLVDCSEALVLEVEMTEVKYIVYMFIGCSVKAIEIVRSNHC